MLPSILLLAFSSVVTGFASFERRSGFPVDVHGPHEFTPPTDDDQRGPCPGLSMPVKWVRSSSSCTDTDGVDALANHNYISHDGIVHLTEVVQAVTGVYNMGLDLGTIIALIAVIWAGDPLTLRFSIGGPDDRIKAPLGGLLGLLGDPQGLDWSHNMIEADASVTRNDLAQFHDAWTMNTTLFQEMMDLVPDGGSYTFDIVGDLAEIRLKETIATDPNMWYGPYSGFIARNAGICFLGRLFANYSTNPTDGDLTHDILRSFFAIDKATNEYNFGWERIPENFYPRPTGYTLIDLNVDLVRWTLQHPQLASIGGNMGQVNTFTPIDLGDPVHGLANAPKLFEGNNLICFALQLLKLASPSMLNNIYSTLEVPLHLVDDIMSTLSPLNCPAWDMLTHGGQPIWEVWKEKYPGAAQTPI